MRLVKIRRYTGTVEGIDKYRVDYINPDKIIMISQKKDKPEDKNCWTIHTEGDAIKTGPRFNINKFRKDCA